MKTKVNSFSWRLDIDHSVGKTLSYSLLEKLAAADEVVAKLEAEIVEVRDTLYTLDGDCPVFVRRITYRES